MKKWICLAMALMLALTMTAAFAEGGLSDFSSRLLEKASKQEAPAEPMPEPAAAEDNSFGPRVTIDDPFFQKVRSSAYLNEDEYSNEANVMIELRNVSGRTLYVDDAAVTAYNAAGEAIAEETYASVGPKMVGDGESLYVWDWFYDDFETIADVDHFEVKIESETSSYRTYEKIAGQALVSGGIAYALIENTTENDIYGLDATIIIEDDAGTLLDVCNVSTGNTVGIFPGSVMVLRDNAENYETGEPLQEGVASVSALHQLD